MSTLTVTEDYSDGSTLTKTQLSTAMTSIETWANGNVDSTNIAAGGVTTACLDTGAVTTAKLATDAVTTVKITDANVTAAKLASDAVTTAKILDANVTTAKIADNAVTQAKRAALGQQVSSAIDFSTSSTNLTTVTSLTVSITTTGRPVFVGLQGSTDDPTANNTGLVGGGTNIGMYYALYRDSTLISSGFLKTSGGTVIAPSSSISCIDVPSSGTYTYSMKIAASGAATVSVYDTKMVAYEL